MIKRQSNKESLNHDPNTTQTQNQPNQPPAKALKLNINTKEKALPATKTGPIAEEEKPNPKEGHQRETLKIKANRRNETEIRKKQLWDKQTPNQ